MINRKKEGFYLILSGKNIQKLQESKLIIDPFYEEQLNPNSYNLRLHNELATYKNTPLDMKKENELETFSIPASGFLLKPNTLYLARTIEYTATDYYVPMLEGRSSIGRLGLNIHVTAGFGDVGFSGYWTLEMHSVVPIWIYPGIDICQIYYHTLQGAFNLYKKGKYSNNQGIQGSKLYLDLN